MNCDEIRKSLEAFIDDEVPEPARQKIQHHLTSCDDCRKQAALLARMNLASRSVKVPNPGREYWKALPARISTQLPFVSRKRPAVSYRMYYRLAAVAAACLIIFVITRSVHKKSPASFTVEAPGDRSTEVVLKEKAVTKKPRKQQEEAEHVTLERSREESDSEMEDKGSGAGIGHVTDLAKIGIEEQAEPRLLGSAGRGEKIVGLDEGGAKPESLAQASASGLAGKPEFLEEVNISEPEKKPESLADIPVSELEGKADVMQETTVSEPEEKSVSDKTDSAHFYYHIDLADVIKTKRPASPSVPVGDSAPPPVLKNEKIVVAADHRERPREEIGFRDISTRSENVGVSPVVEPAAVSTPQIKILSPVKIADAVKIHYNLSDTLFVLQHLLYQPVAPESDSGAVTFTRLLESYGKSELRKTAMRIPGSARPSAVLQTGRLFLQGVQKKNLYLLQPAALNFYQREKVILQDSLGADVYLQNVEIFKAGVSTQSPE